jgi:RNA polymerase sigma factor (sigma-70 family)
VPQTPRELLIPHHRRLYLAVRSLVPVPAEAAAVLREALVRLAPWAAEPEAAFRARADRIILEAASEHRRNAKGFPSSDDLFRQLVEHPDRTADATDRATRFAEILKCLPSPDRDLLRRRYELGMSLEQIGLAEGRSQSAVARDLAALHASITRELFRDPTKTSPHADEIGRLTGRLADGTLGADGRLVLETLLLAEPLAQTDYFRILATLSELSWRLTKPSFPDVSLPRTRLTVRERVVTTAFVLSVIGALALIAWAVRSQTGE